MQEICPGCGVVIQSKDPNLTGYINPNIYLKKNDSFYCERCYKLRHYNQEIRIPNNHQNFKSVLEEIKKAPGLVVLVLNVLDLDGSIIPSLNSLIGKSEILVVVNKCDLLSKDISKDKLHLAIKKYLDNNELNYCDLLLMSSFKKNDVNLMIEKIQSYYNKRNVYFVGITNVGKSTLINQIIFNYNNKKDVLTTSNTINTTLGSIYIPFGKGSFLVDTPAYYNETNLIYYLTKEHLEKITANNIIKPKVYQLFPSQSLFIQGLVRIDFIKGIKSTFVTYFKNDLLIHRSKLERADIFYQKHKNDILRIPNQYEIGLIGSLIYQDYEFSTNVKLDISIAGLGVITFIGMGIIRVHSYQKITIKIRESLI